ncbi:MAG: ABC transporter ATP-binding protein [Clostridia bacterium]|nr:ABC transporter ATP-binding protein [Clostridia bacterium]
MKSKSTKKKPYRSVWSNAIWSFRGMLRYAPMSFWVLTLCVPANLLVAWGELFLPSTVVMAVTHGESLMQAALRVGLLLFAILLGTLGRDSLRTLSHSYVGLYRYRTTEELNRKSSRVFYQTFEKPAMRELRDRAIAATQMWNGAQALGDMPREFLELVEAILGYAFFGTVISFASPWLFPLLTVAPLVNWVCVRAYQKWEYAVREERESVSHRLNYVENEAGSFAVAKDVRIYSMAGWFGELYRDYTVQKLRWDRRRILRSFASRLADLFVILLRDGAAYAWLIAMTLRGEITVDRFVLYFTAISSFASWVGKLLSGWLALQETSLKICDFREYVDLPEEDFAGEASVEPFLKKIPDITFDHVSFRYEGSDRDTICDLSFTLHAGEKLALVGLNGAGKTTLVKLLCGLYRPTGGRILVGGIPVERFSLHDYYRLFAPVFQDVRTAFFTLAETVSDGMAEAADLDRVEDCLRLAGLGDKLDTLPLGIHTPLDKQIHKDGTELSGGEAQKMMLARALYKDAPILILDEPTAALDPIAESAIYGEYQRMTAGKSSIFISHRLASCRFCDRIFFMAEGKIAEEGDHETLMAQGGAYATLFDLQSVWYREGENKA